MEEQNREENADQPEPELLYRYTTQHGLLGILKDQEIWATHLQYLNDTTEGMIFTELLLSELRERAAKSPTEVLSHSGAFGRLLALQVMGGEGGKPHADEVLDLGSATFSWITAQDTFVTSFSGQGDLLSQWRAYSGETGGYSIGFTRPYLESVGVHFLAERKESFYGDSNPLVKCLYCDKSTKESLKREIEQIVDSYIAEVDRSRQQAAPGTREEFRTLATVAKRHFFPLSRQRAMTKDQAFLEEAESRLVFQLERIGTPESEPEFRPGRSMLIPYFKVKLTWENQVLRIPKVIVGPCPHPFESKKSVERLLRKTGVEKFEVKNSQIPYRSW